MAVSFHRSSSDISFQVGEYEEFSRRDFGKATVKTWRSKLQRLNVVLLGLGLLCMIQAILNICLRLSLRDSSVALSSSPTPVTRTLPPSINGTREVEHCPQDWLMFNSRCYYISSQRNNWDNSRRDCIQREGDLVVIDNRLEQAFLSRFSAVVWVGMTDRKREGTFEWVDGTPVDTNQLQWAPGQPDNSNNGEDCGDLRNMTDFMGLNDAKCTNVIQWICEKAPS